MSLEGIIRPFESGKVSPSKPVPSSDEEATPPDNLIITAKGSPPKTFSGSFSVDITYYHVRKPKEIANNSSSPIDSGSQLDGGPNGPEAGNPPLS